MCVLVLVLVLAWLAAVYAADRRVVEVVIDRTSVLAAQRGNQQQQNPRWYKSAVMVAVAISSCLTPHSA